MRTDEGGPEALGVELRARRGSLGKSLKAIAEPADISVAYLVKLEKGEVAAPSPHVLRRLAETLDIGYLDLMERAGYISAPAASDVGTSPRSAIRSAALTDDEAVALSTYLEVYRANKQR
jgi:transcriptional regulator with XRE-family HTH domain